MRTQEEIDLFVSELKNLQVSYTEAQEIDAIINVLENDFSYEDIEEQYFDENQTEIECRANMALDFKDGEIEKEEILGFYK